MLNDFFIRALLAGVGIALITGPLGCFVVWRRLSFFAGTLAHSALLGVTMALVFEINIAFSVFLISAVLAIFLLQLQHSLHRHLEPLNTDQHTVSLFVERALFITTLFFSDFD